MLSVKFLPQVDQGFYTVDCSEVASVYYASQVQALITYLRSLGYRSSKLTVVVGALTLGQRNNASDVARFVRPLRVQGCDLRSLLNPQAEIKRLRELFG